MKNKEIEFKWGWCDLCRTAFIICPKCGNNCCNAGYGEINGKSCDVCPLAYQYQHLAWDSGMHPWSEKEFEQKQLGEDKTLEEIFGKQGENVKKHHAKCKHANNLEKIKYFIRYHKKMMKKFQGMLVNDLPARFEYLFTLRDGWLDGEGKAPDANGLVWFLTEWIKRIPSTIANPYIYPTPDGNIQLEWTANHYDIEIKVNLRTKKINVFALERMRRDAQGRRGGIVEKELSEKKSEINLKTKIGWGEFITFLNDFVKEKR